MVPEDEESIELPNEPQPEEQVVQEHQHRYPRRQRTAPVRYGIDEFVDTAFLDEVQIEESKSIEEALKDQEWKEAADSEYQSLMENETWKLVKFRRNTQVMAKSSAIKLDLWQKVTPKNQEKTMMKRTHL